MEWFKEQIRVETRGKGLYPITDLISPLIAEWSSQEGICHLFIQHTSASLRISDMSDLSARLAL